MRKVIDGKAYDTSTADLICDISRPGFNSTDFEWDHTGLYRTKKGAFFIAGEGNALSRWFVSVGKDGRGGGEGLTLVDEQEARGWVEQFGTPEDFVKCFGEPEEG